MSSSVEDATESARLRQSQIFAASHIRPEKEGNAPITRSGAAKLLEKKQKMFELQEALEEEKLRFAEKEEGFKHREDVMKAKNSELEDSLIRFSKYLQENDAKRARAFKKAADERRLCEEKSTEAEELSTLSDNLRQELAEAREVVARNMSYQQYLERVMEEKDSFQEIGDIMTRHATLAATNETLRQQQQAAAEEIEKIRLETQAYARGRTEEILAASTAIPRLRKDIEAAQQEAAALEGVKREASLKAASSRLEQGKVTLVVRHLYQRCLENSKVAHSSQADLGSQLKVIGSFIADLTSILQEHNVKVAVRP